MHIYIDDSGQCLPPGPNKRNLACMGGLVIPEKNLAEVTTAFSTLTKAWGARAVESKGSSLNELEIAAVIALLIENGCIFFVSATEMSANTVSDIKRYQQIQSQYLTDGLSGSAHPDLVSDMNGLRAIFERMPQQLFMQLIVLLPDLLKNVIDIATLHFALTAPSEAGAFKWVIDGKNERKTQYEAAWERAAGALIQGRYLEPSTGFMAEEGDYSHFARFSSVDQNWPKHLPPPPQTGYPRQIFDLGKILYESLTFTGSNSSIGLQLADIVTNAFRRAMMGRLQADGYQRLGELMIHVGTSPIQLLRFSDDDSQPKVDDYMAPYQILKSRSRWAGSEPQGASCVL